MKESDSHHQNTPPQHLTTPGYPKKNGAITPLDHPDEQPDEHDDILNENIPEDEKIRAMEDASRIMSKSKNKMHFKTHNNTKESWLVYTMRRVISAADKVINPHNYKFENNREAAKYNTKLLKRDKYDLARALKQQKGTMMEPGSELRQ